MTFRVVCKVCEEVIGELVSDGTPITSMVICAKCFKKNQEPPPVADKGSHGNE